MLLNCCLVHNNGIYILCIMFQILHAVKLVVNIIKLFFILQQQFHDTDFSTMKKRFWFYSVYSQVKLAFRFLIIRWLNLMLLCVRTIKCYVVYSFVYTAFFKNVVRCKASFNNITTAIWQLVPHLACIHKIVLQLYSNLYYWTIDNT